MPQLIEWPRCFSEINVKARIKKLEMIPIEVNKKDFLTFLTSKEFSLIIDASFNEITGRTQGIKFKIKPPTKANKTK